MLEFPKPQIENLVASKEPRLSKGIRRHIRKLKEEGKLSEALQVRKEAVISKRDAKQRLQDELNINLQKAIISNDPKEQVIGEFSATFIISHTEGLSQEERAADLETVYRNHPNEEAFLEGKASSLVAEISKLIKEADNS